MVGPAVGVDLAVEAVPVVEAVPAAEADPAAEVVPAAEFVPVADYAETGEMVQEVVHMGGIAVQVVSPVESMGCESGEGDVVADAE